MQPEPEMAAAVIGVPDAVQEGSSLIVRQELKSNSGVLNTFSNRTRSWLIGKFGCWVLIRSLFLDTPGSTQREPLTDVSIYLPFFRYRKRISFHQLPLREMRVVPVHHHPAFRILPCPQQLSVPPQSALPAAARAWSALQAKTTLSKTASLPSSISRTIRPFRFTVLISGIQHDTVPVCLG